MRQTDMASNLCYLQWVNLYHEMLRAQGGQVDTDVDTIKWVMIEHLVEQFVEEFNSSMFYLKMATGQM